MRLYHGEPNGPSLTALAALFECGLDAEQVHIDLTRAERHAERFANEPEVALSVEGEGPVLVNDDDAICDSVFMACYFDEAAGGDKIRPTDPYQRWEMMTWCRQVIERVAPAAAYLGTEAYLSKHLQAVSSADFDKMMDKINSLDLRERWIQVRNKDFDADKLADSKNKITSWLEKIEERVAGQDWLMDKFSIADIETFAWISGIQNLMPEAFAASPRALGWMDRVRRRPSVTKALSMARTEAPEKVWAPGPEINRWG